MTVKARHYDERYSTLIGIFYYLSFFGGKGVDMAIDKASIRNR